jgi:hypothetical protein
MIRSIMLRPFLLLLLLSTLDSQAQMVQKCCGTQNSTFLLGNTNYARHSQCIYLPGDFQGAMPGWITKIYYRYGTTGIGVDQHLQDFRIGFLQNNATGFVNSQFYTGVSTAMATPELLIPAGVTDVWFTIPLEQPFYFDPSLTLIVDIAFEESTTMNFGTRSTNSPGRKLYSPSTTSPTGQSTVNSLQDVGFDLDVQTMVPRLEPMITTLGPNPATDRLHLETTGLPISLEVLDASGMVIQSARPAAARGGSIVDVSGLSSGLYLLRIISAEGHVETHRFIRE